MHFEQGLIRLSGQNKRVMFVYLGRRGSLGRFTIQLARAAADFEHLNAVFMIARSGEIAPLLDEQGYDVLKLDTYERWPIPSIVTNFATARRKMICALSRNPPDAVVTLMPHIWTPVLAPAIKQEGIPYVTVAHDAVSHPGDPTGILTPWLLQDVALADLVVTLSQSVADRLVAERRTAAGRILSLFHPDLHYGEQPAQRQRSRETPLRLLFFGRIMKYKGLPFLLDAVEMLRSEGVNLTICVAGLGNINSERPRLVALGAEVINSWIEDHAVGPLLDRHDAVVVSHTEASQSGVAATAFGRCLPVVGMPVGGITEQVIDGRTGVLAQGQDVRSLANAIRRLTVDYELYEFICDHLRATAPERSMRRFLGALIGAIDSKFGNG